jgi:hypothetical protein
MIRSWPARAFDLLGPTDDLRNPLWVVRTAPAISLICLILAEALWKSGFAHGLCIALSAGQLVVLCVAGFQINGATYKNREQPSDVQDFRLTR